MSHLVIVGGSDAGISAALRARELESSTRVTLIVEDAFPNYSICGLPSYLSGEVSDYHQLAHRTQAEITDAGIDLLLEQTAYAIDPSEHQVTVANGAKQLHQLSYDRLVLATAMGARSRRPHIDGLDLPGVFLLHSMEDSFQIQHYLTSHTVRSALIVGGGYIGLEMADALTLRGLSVTLVEHGKSVLKTVDPTLGALVQAELERHEVVVHTGIGVQQIRAEGADLCVSGAGTFEARTDLVIDTYATALFHKMTVEALSDLDLSYTPPLRSPWDLVQMGAQEWC